MFINEHKSEGISEYLTQVYASYYYSAAITSLGEIYTWGSGEFGRLGYAESKKQS